MPAGTYEATKLESDRLVMEAEARGALTVSILRPSNVFGPSMTNRSLFALIRMIESGWFFFIGKPGASANYVHVDNVVKALCLCGTKATARGRVYNISDHRTLEEFAGTIANELGVNPPKLRLPEPLARTGVRLFKWFPRFPLTQSRVDALVNRATYPIDRIEQDLQYGHIVSMEDGLRQLTEVWRQRRQESNSVWSYPAH